MTTGHLSTADRALLETLKGRRVTVAGKPVSATQLRAWRRRGLIDAPSITSRGRHGRQSSYGPEIVEQVEKVAALLTSHRNLDEAVLVAFGLGRNPPEASLRAAYRGYIDRQQGAATKIIDDEARLASVTRAVFASPPEFGPLGAARNIVDAAVSGAGWSGPVKESTSPAQRRQQQVGDMLGLVAEGAESIAEQAENIGLAPYLAERTGRPLSDVMLEFGDQSHPSPQQMRQRVDTADYENLTRVRDFLLPIVRAMAALEVGAALPDDGRPLGLFVATLVAASRRAPPEALMQTLNTQTVATELAHMLEGGDT